MQEAPRRSLSVEFANGDKLHIRCKEACILSLIVNGKSFVYSAKDLLGLEPLGNEASLLSGLGSNEYKAHRETYFGFELDVLCPEALTTVPYHRCKVGGVVQDGKLTNVELFQEQTTVLSSTPK